MMRLLGALVGSLLAVTALVFLVGIPRIQTEPRYAPIGDNGVIRLPERPAPEPGPPEFPAVLDSASPDEVPGEAETAVDSTVDETSEASDLLAPETPAESLFDSPEPAAEGLQWYAFWSPFRSEIAANGFVTQLQRVTGLDYRVVKVKAGVYEVAFAYNDENQILSNLSQISAATGLQLPGD